MTEAHTQAFPQSHFEIFINEKVVYEENWCNEYLTKGRT